MATWQAIVGDTTYSLSDSNPFKVISLTGIGNAPVRRLEERGPFQDGVTDVGYRFDPRLINMVIGVHSSSLSSADTNRDTLSAIFNPTGGRMVQLRCTRDDGAVRQIDCYVGGMVDMPAELPERTLAFQRVGVQLKAPNPMWYDPTIQGVVFESPVLPWYTGDGLIGTARVLANSGTPAAGSAIAVAGTSTKWTLYLRTSGDTPPSGAGARGLFYVGSGGTASSGAWYEAGTAAAYGTVTVRDTAGIAANTFDFGAGSVDMWFVNSSGANVAGYSGSVLVSNVNGLVAPSTWFDIPARGSVVLGSVPAGNSWAGTITHAALYNYALSLAERAAVQTAITSPTARMNGTATVAGSWEEYPVITLTGPVASPVMTNLATGEVLDFTGSTINAGDFYRIDTRYGYKTITNSAGSSVLQNLTNDSDIATFHLAPGANALLVTFSGGTTSASGVAMSYYNRYLGL